MSDAQLMRLVMTEDDPLAFALIYERYLPVAMTLAVQICSRRAVAEEVVQEAFLSLWRARGRYDRRRGEVRRWLLWTVRNRAIDAFRQSAPHEAAQASEDSLDGLLAAHEQTDREARRRERTREVLASLDGLPDEQSHVIALAYYGGYTHSEIAAMLGTPLGTVKGRMRLGLRKLADSPLAAA